MTVAPLVPVGAAFGAALLGGVAAGTFSSVAEAASLAAMRDTIDPDPVWATAYRDAYARFRELYPALRPKAGAAVTP